MGGGKAQGVRAPVLISIVPNACAALPPGAPFFMDDDAQAPPVCPIRVGYTISAFARPKDLIDESMTPNRLKRLQQVLDRRQPDLTVFMEGVHKPHNLNAIARTCDAVGVLEAHALSAQTRVRTRDKAAAGVRKWLPIRTHATLEQAYASLRTQGCQLIAAHPAAGARDFREIDYTRPTAIVVGAELDGLSQSAVRQADTCVIVPMAGMVASLNVSVATALILFEAQRQRAEAGFYDRPRLEPEAYRRLLFEWAHPHVAAKYRAENLPYPGMDEAGTIMG